MTLGAQEPAVRSSAFFIPTNRECGAAIRSYCHELEFARAAFGRLIPLAVSETDDGPDAAANTVAIARVAAERPDQEILHLTVPRQQPYFAKLLAGEPDRLRKLFADGRRDYGTAMNKICLMTGSLGADALHRRDSDTTLLGDELPADRGRFPIEIELANLGRRVSATRAERRSAHVRQSGDLRICVVGGNYYGEWNLDVTNQHGGAHASDRPHANHAPCARRGPGLTRSYAVRPGSKDSHWSSHSPPSALA